MPAQQRRTDLTDDWIARTYEELRKEHHELTNSLGRAEGSQRAQAEASRQVASLSQLMAQLIRFRDMRRKAREAD
jgi:flagellar biosynthesis/type III secretory pathway protein FliH